jgi:hypothetical protein
MKKNFPSIFLLFPTGLILLLFISCGPAVLVENTPSASSTAFETPTFFILETPTLPVIQFASTACPGENYPCPSDSMTLTAAMKPTLDAMMTANPLCSYPCPSDSLTLTAEMGATLAAIPSNTQPPWATIIPSVGDLGWGSVYGTIRDGVTNLPIEGATVKCEHFSYTSPYLCNGTTTNQDGIYAFTGVFFHDTDHITLIVEAPGYTTLRFEQAFFTRAEFSADLGLFPPSANPTSTPTPFIMCTPPACLGGTLTCGSLNGCLGGCGTICIMGTSTPY